MKAYTYNEDGKILKRYKEKEMLIHAPHNESDFRKSPYIEIAVCGPKQGTSIHLSIREIKNVLKEFEKPEE